MRLLLARLLHDRRGVTMVEYGLIIGLVGLAVVIGATVLGQSLTVLYNTVASAAVPAITSGVF